MVSYSINKNNDYLQLSLSNKHLLILDEYNKQYFQQNNVDYDKIINGQQKTPFNEDYTGICKLLDEYTRQQAETFKNLLTQERK